MAIRCKNPNFSSRPAASCLLMTLHTAHTLGKQNRVRQKQAVKPDDNPMFRVILIGDDGYEKKFVVQSIQV
jgi:hypothetical protein